MPFPAATTSRREPLAALPLVASRSTSSTPSKLSLVASPRTMSLLPSPFFARDPLAIRASPARRMMQVDAELEDAPTEMPSTPPRRLLDVFLGSSVRSGSPAPQVPWSPMWTGENASAPDDAPTWSFWEDPVDDDPVPPFSSALNPPPSSLEDEDLSEPDEPKENTRPAPRRPRSTSLLSHSRAPNPVAPSTPTDDPDPEPSPPSSPTLMTAHPEGENVFGEGIAAFGSPVSPPLERRRKRNSYALGGSEDEPLLGSEGSVKRQKLAVEEQ